MRIAGSVESGGEEGSVAGPREELGDGTGALCPVCPSWFGTVDDAWRDHVVGEHPDVWDGLRAAVASRNERASVRRAMQAEAEAVAEQVRDRHRAA